MGKLSLDGSTVGDEKQRMLWALQVEAAAYTGSQEPFLQISQPSLGNRLLNRNTAFSLWLSPFLAGDPSPGINPGSLCGYSHPCTFPNLYLVNGIKHLLLCCGYMN